MLLRLGRTSDSIFQCILWQNTHRQEQQTLHGSLIGIFLDLKNPISGFNQYETPDFHVAIWVWQFN